MLLLLDNTTVFVFEALERIECPRMNLLTEHTSVEHPEAVYVGDLPREAIDEIEKALQPSIWKHVVNPEDIEVGPDTIDSACPLHHPSGIPMEVVI